jgi:four helix bundle protein
MVKKKKIKSYEDLEVWTIGHRLCLEIYKITNDFPKSELFALVSQLRRASSSIPANIVEGYYRNTTKELIQFLYHSRGSCGEIIYFLILSKDLKYISSGEYLKLKRDYDILIKKVTAMINSLKKRL